jgi:hypothetical protein
VGGYDVLHVSNIHSIPDKISEARSGGICRL